jgi:hypothetical protein
MSKERWKEEEVTEELRKGRNLVRKEERIVENNLGTNP